MGVMSAHIGVVIAKAGHSVDIERSIASEDDLGGRERVWVTVTDDIACWVQPVSLRSNSATIEWYAKKGITITHRIYFTTDPGVQTTDRVLFGSRYFVVEGAINTAETDELYIADCREVTTT